MNNLPPGDIRYIAMLVPAGIPGNYNKELIVSVSFNINKYSRDFIEFEGSPNNYSEFISSLIDFKERKLNIKFSSDKIKSIKSVSAKNPFEYYLKNEIKLSNKRYSEIKNDLWDKLFHISKDVSSGHNTFSKTIDIKSKVKNYNHSKPEMIIKNIEDNMVPNFLIASDQNFNPPQNKLNINILNKLKLISDFAADRIATSKVEYKNFISRIENNGVLNSLHNDVHLLKNNEIWDEIEINPIIGYAKLYAEFSHQIEIDEIVHSFSKIADDPILSRMMGLTIDYKLTFDYLPKEDFFLLSASSDNSNGDLHFLPTPISIITNTTKDKWAYLVKNKDNKFFKNSLLKKEHVNFQTFDKIAKIIKQEDDEFKQNNGEKLNKSGTLDSNTRGILVTHSKLDEIIKPFDIVNDTENPTQFINELCDEHFERGHRVYISYNESSNFKFFPLTSRAVKIKYKNKNLFINRDIGSCLHFDSPMAFMENGKIKYATTDVMFEYSGELLKLKSAFAKAENINAKEYSEDTLENTDDDGLLKIIERWNLHLKYFTFPSKNPSKVDIGKYQIFYDIPEEVKSKYFPKLRFNRSYSFIVSQEYINGWGLPLAYSKNISKIQLTINDLISDEVILSMERPFLASENKRAPILIHTKKVSEDLENSKIIEKPSLDHFVVRSNNAKDTNSVEDKRHILPPKIELETAFWHGILSPAYLKINESFKLKSKANCPYNNANDRISQKRRCLECNKLTYCGGINLKDYYPSNSISPPFLTDPTVQGINIKLYHKWDVNENKGIPVKPVLENNLTFEGKPGTGAKSYLLVANGAKSVTYTEDHSMCNYFEISLKKGAEMYALLTNNLKKESQRDLINGIWFLQLRSLLEKPKSIKLLMKNVNKLSFTREEKEILKLKNPPKVIKLTHAVKEPLIIPKILKMSSSPSDRKCIEHLNNWLKEDEYENYKLDINIIGNRINKDKIKDTLINSSFAQIDLTSHFERLDAIKKIQFLDDIIPTGGLELWVRKEVFIDDPEQIVLPILSEANHFPNDPIVKFTDPSNIFTLDHKIEFNYEILSQLKNIKNIEDIESIDDVFRSLITKLNLQFDFKSTHFEEREYYLKNISKFKGFFTSENLIDLEVDRNLKGLEEYVLPKGASVMNKLHIPSEIRFKVLVLNNKQPEKPDVAYAITTIQEKRINPDTKKTITIQRGNIVTIYLKRGRLKSGKNERVGIIVDTNSLYNELYKVSDMISKVGRDIISDRYSNRSQYLQYGDIIIPEINDFKAGFDNELGIYHFLPKFEIEKQLWKFEVELNIITENGKQLHNPFINFSIVHYQPFSLNYNVKTKGVNLIDLKKDCRLSDVENSTWCYLLPERNLSIYFDKPNCFFDEYGEVNLTISYDFESLHHFNCANDEWKIRSNFIVTIQGSETGEALDWHYLDSWIDNGNIKIDIKNSGLHHPLLSEASLESRENLASVKLKFTKWVNNNKTSKKYSQFRVRFVEVEWFANETWNEVIKRTQNESPQLLNTDIQNNEEMRIRYVELIY